MENSNGTEKINIIFANLTNPLESFCALKGTSLEDFCKQQKIGLTDSVRVNTKRVDGNYILQDNDIVTKIPKVSGGC